MFVVSDIYVSLWQDMSCHCLPVIIVFLWPFGDLLLLVMGRTLSITSDSDKLFVSCARPLLEPLPEAVPEVYGALATA